MLQYHRYSHWMSLLQIVCPETRCPLIPFGCYWPFYRGTHDEYLLQLLHSWRLVYPETRNPFASVADRWVLATYSWSSAFRREEWHPILVSLLSDNNRVMMAVAGRPSLSWCRDTTGRYRKGRPSICWGQQVIVYPEIPILNHEWVEQTPMVRHHLFGNVEPTVSKHPIQILLSKNRNITIDYWNTYARTWHFTNVRTVTKPIVYKSLWGFEKLTVGVRVHYDWMALQFLMVFPL